jgi:hypothetical protein
VSGKAAWCVVAAALSISALRPQDRARTSYREIVEEFRTNPDAAVEQMLDLPDDVVANGIDDASRRESVWPLQSRGAALVMHSDAALYLLPRNRAAAWTQLDHARLLAGVVARDPESAWLVHQWFVVVTTALRDDPGVKALIEHWHAQPWYAATAAMDHGLEREAYGLLYGRSHAAGPSGTDAYTPEAFGEAASSYRQALAAHLEIAAVHLGRIEMLRGHAEDARHLFGQAADNSHWRTTIYLANLFLGSMEERDGESSAAERRYRAAVGSVSAQSGRLALVSFLGRSGRSPEALTALTGGSGDTPFTAFDPWWSYVYPYSDRLTSYRMILAELHVAVSR